MINRRFALDWYNGTFTMENLGDSVAAGSSGPPHVADRWWDLVSKALPNGGTVWNGAIGGSIMREYMPTSMGGSAKWIGHTEFTRAVKPTAISLNWRINEQFHARPIAEFKSDYFRFIDYLREGNSSATILIHDSPLVLDPILDNVNGPKQIHYKQALREIAEATNDAVYIDWGVFFPKSGTDWVGMFGPDRIHPSAVGNRAQAATTYQAIKSLAEGYLL